MAGIPDETASLFQIRKLRREEEEFKKLYEERKRELESLDQRVEEKRKEHKKVLEANLSFEKFLKIRKGTRSHMTSEGTACQAAGNLQREWQEMLQKEAEVERLKEELAELTKQKQELGCEVQSHTVYKDIMEQSAKMSGFEGVEMFADHLGSLLQLRDTLCQRHTELSEQINQTRKALVTMKDQHNINMLQTNYQLSQLQNMLQDTQSECLIWEKKWDQIQETEAKKTLMLEEIKMATSNLCEMAGGSFHRKSVDMNDTGQQLDWIKTFIQDTKDILKTHQTLSEDDGQKTGKKSRKPNATGCKKHQDVTL